jgi:DNA-binding XRE family transcriptional regulator
MGSDVKTVGRIERGEFLPSLPTLIKLATHVHASLDELVGLTQPAPDVVETQSRLGEVDLKPSVAQVARDLAELGREVERLRRMVERGDPRARRSAG